MTTQDFTVYKTTLRSLNLRGFNELGFSRDGPMLYNKNDIYMGGSYRLYGEFCRYEQELLLSLILPGATVIEVGANMGGHTIPIAKKAGFVYAFEPQRLVFQLLNANIALHHLTNVWAYQQAVGETGGEIAVPFLLPESRSNTGAVELGHKAEFAYSEAVPLIRLDSLVTPYDGKPVKPALIKIDVEGMESDVIFGAQGMIESARPILYVENDRREKSESLIRDIQDLGYRLHWHLPALYHPDNFFQNHKEEWPGCVSVNMLCVPKERTLKTALPEVKGPLDRPF